MYEVNVEKPLDAPVLVVAFEGWVSAGSAGTASAAHIADDSPVVTTFDSDRLYDYRVNRPTLDFVDGMIDEIDWPATTIRLRRIGERDVLVLTGPEPNWGWRAFGEAIGDLATDLGVIQQVSLGGIPWPAPHTRPTIVVTTASRRDLIAADANFPEGLLRVPGSAASIVEKAVADRGVPTVGFWARVPHYVGGIYYPAVVSLVERVSRHLGIDIPLGSLVDDAAAQRRHLSEALEDQPPIREIVAQLEAAYDASGEVASGEEIAAEIERYLRERGEAE
jgi:hypothetical protein